MTFHKRDPDLITLFFASPDDPGPDPAARGRTRQYRVSKRKELVDALQTSMLRLK
jgi:hypothetical protein